MIACKGKKGEKKTFFILTFAIPLDLLSTMPVGFSTVSDKPWSVKRVKVSLTFILCVGIQISMLQVQNISPGHVRWKYR